MHPDFRLANIALSDEPGRLFLSGFVPTVTGKWGGMIIYLVECGDYDQQAKIYKKFTIIKKSNSIFELGDDYGTINFINMIVTLDNTFMIYLQTYKTFRIFVIDYSKLMP